VDVTARTAVPEELVLWARLPGSAALLAQVRIKLEKGARGNRVTVGADLTPNSVVT